VPAHFGYRKLSLSDLLEQGFCYSDARRLWITAEAHRRTRKLSPTEAYLLFHRYLYLNGAYADDATPERPAPHSPSA
jgi:hypothetical protein